MYYHRPPFMGDPYGNPIRDLPDFHLRPQAFYFRPQDFLWKTQALHLRPKAFHWSIKFLIKITGFSIKFHWRLKVFFVETTLFIRDPLIFSLKALRNIFIEDPFEFGIWVSNEKLGLPKNFLGACN